MLWVSDIVYDVYIPVKKVIYGVLQATSYAALSNTFFWINSRAKAVSHTFLYMSCLYFCTKYLNAQINNVLVSGEQVKMPSSCSSIFVDECLEMRGLVTICTWRHATSLGQQGVLFVAKGQAIQHRAWQSVVITKIAKLMFDGVGAKYSTMMCCLES